MDLVTPQPADPDFDTPTLTGSPPAADPPTPSADRSVGASADSSVGAEPNDPAASPPPGTISSARFAPTVLDIQVQEEAEAAPEPPLPRSTGQDWAPQPPPTASSTARPSPGAPSPIPPQRPAMDRSTSMPTGLMATGGGSGLFGGPLEDEHGRRLTGGGIFLDVDCSGGGGGGSGLGGSSVMTSSLRQPPRSILKGGAHHVNRQRRPSLPEVHMRSRSLPEGGGAPVDSPLPVDPPGAATFFPPNGPPPSSSEWAAGAAAAAPSAASSSAASSLGSPSSPSSPDGSSPPVRFVRPEGRAQRQPSFVHFNLNLDVGQALDKGDRYRCSYKCGFIGYWAEVEAHEAQCWSSRAKAERTVAWVRGKASRAASSVSTMSAGIFRRASISRASEAARPSEAAASGGRGVGDGGGDGGGGGGGGGGGSGDGEPPAAEPVMPI